MRTNYFAYCNTTENLEVHHNRPQCSGGGDEESNLLTICATCHGITHEMSETYGAIKARKHRDTMDLKVERRQLELKIREARAERAFDDCAIVVSAHCTAEHSADYIFAVDRYIDNYFKIHDAVDFIQTALAHYSYFNAFVDVSWSNYWIKEMIVNKHSRKIHIREAKGYKAPCMVCV